MKQPVEVNFSHPELHRSLVWIGIMSNARMHALQNGRLIAATLCWMAIRWETRKLGVRIAPPGRHE